MLTIAHLSDSHVADDPDRAPFNGVIDTDACFARAVAAVADLVPAPSLCIHTGDLAERGTPEEYRLARGALEALAPRVPVVAIPGNHDDREAMRAAFSDLPWMPAQGPIRFVVDLDVLRLVMLDTVVPGATHGALDQAQLAWLDAALGASSRPAVVAMHHPPFDTGVGFMDALGLREGRDALDALLRRHAHVQRVLCGHVHRAMTTSFGGTIGIVAPGTAHQIRPHLVPVGRAEFALDPPGFVLHRFDGRAMQSHFVNVEQGAGPYPYR